MNIFCLQTPKESSISTDTRVTNGFKPPSKWKKKKSLNISLQLPYYGNLSLYIVFNFVCVPIYFLQENSEYYQ